MAVEREKTPLVSIIITYYSYGNPEWLLESVSSAAQQTYKNIEIIVVDDCSPKPTAATVLKDFPFPRLKCVRNQRNRGTAAARNRGVSLSKGEYFVSLDFDDTLNESFIAAAMEKLNSPEIGGVFSLLQFFQGSNQIHTPSCDIIDVMCAEASVHSMLCRREVFDTVGGYNENVWHSDIHFLLGALAKNWKFQRIDRPLVRYRKHPQGKSNYNEDKVLPGLIEFYPKLYAKHHQEIIKRLDRQYVHSTKEYGRALASCQQTVESLDGMLQSSHDEETNLQLALQARELALSQLGEKFSQLEAERDEGIAKIQSLLDEREQAKTRLETLLAERLQWSKRVDGLLAERDQAKIQIETLLFEQDQWSKQVDGLVAEREQGKTQIETLLAEQDQWNEQVEGLLASREEWKRHSENFALQWAVFKAQAASLTEKAASLEAERGHWQRHSEYIAIERDQFEKQAEELAEQAKAFEADRDDWKRHAEYIGSEREQFKVQAQALAADRDDWKRHSEYIGAERDQWKKHSAQMEKERDHWTGQTARLKAIRSDLEKESILRPLREMARMLRRYRRKRLSRLKPELSE